MKFYSRNKDFNLPTVDVRYFASIEFGSAGGRRPELDRLILTEKQASLYVKVVLYSEFFSSSTTATNIHHSCLLASLSYGQNKTVTEFFSFLSIPD